MKRSTQRAQSRTTRPAFSLVELLVVVVIIAILMAFLLPAIGNVRITTRLTQVKTEMKQLDAGIAGFKGRFGVEPPSLVVIPNPSSSGVAWDAISKRRIRQIWPRFDFNNSGGLDVGYFGGRDYIVLSGAECLVFFLGGIRDSNGVLTGFSKNPRTPFALPGGTVTATNRDTFFEFDNSRLVDVDGDGFVEYLDTLPGQTTPYLYVSSYGGSGYRSQVPGAVDDFDVFCMNDANGGNPTGGSGGACQPYSTTGGSISDTGGTSENLSFVYHQDAARKIPLKAQSYQLISAGEDKLYGAQGSGYTGAGVLDPDNMPLGERDNLGNFTEGLTLGN